MTKKLKIGVSACLLGDEVRFNGGHCHMKFITETLGKYADLEKVCPEVAIGMSIPRESVRLERNDENHIRMIAPKSGRDFTEDMVRYSAEQAKKMQNLDLDGFVFKRNSPSCGVFRVKIYQNGQPAERNGSGLFAKALIEANPLLPVEEDGRLCDPLLRENFMERVYAFRRVKDLFNGVWRRKDIINFHSREKLLLMAHSPNHYREMGKLVGEISNYPSEVFSYFYIQMFMDCMNIKPTKGKHANALMHMAGYLKKQLGPQGRQELSTSIEKYRTGVVPLIVPVTLLSHMIRRFDATYLSQQTYLSPHPYDLALRNHA